MSRPSSSVPHHWETPGGSSRLGRSICAGSCGASHGAKIAQSTKITTSTTPIAASGLWRATRGSEMAVVDIASKSSYPTAISNCEPVNLKPQRSRRTAAEVAEKAFNREVRKASPQRAQRKAHCLRTAIIDVAAIHCRILGFNAVDIASKSSYPTAITNCEPVNLKPQRSRRTAAEVAVKAFNREVRKASPQRRKEKRIASGLPSSMWVPFTAGSSDSTLNTPGPSGN
jgi:hypothetical protein